MILAPELFISWVVGVSFVGLFIIIAFICDILERKNR